MVALKAADAPESDRPLRADVDLLGRILGDTLREQQGLAIFDFVEHIRQTAICFRRTEEEAARRELEVALSSLSHRDAIHVIRAYTYFLHLANIAEDQHQIRRMRAEMLPGSPSPEGTMAFALARIREAGISIESLEAFLKTALIEPVLTAHPTEVRRRSTIEAEMAIAKLLARQDTVALTPLEKNHLEEALRREVLTLWQTNLVRDARLSILDEVVNGLSYYTLSVVRLFGTTRQVI